MPQEPVCILQNGLNKSYALATSIRRVFQRFQHANHVHFASDPQVQYSDPFDETPFITYDSGADGRYINEQDGINASLLILHKSSKLLT